NMPVAAAPSKLFGADSPHRAIGSLADPNPSSGTIPVDRVIQGPYYTQLSNNIGSLALDPVLNYLYVGNGTSILVFYMASTANGDVSPLRAISGIGNTGSLFLDTASNRLYVGDDVNGVKVFNGASTVSGAPAPDRAITGDFGATFVIHGVAVDTTARNILYVSNTNHTTSSDQISVFANADTVNNSVVPTRTITPNPASAVGGIFLDTGNDRLYVAGGAGATTVMVFNGASAADGSTPPTKTLSGFPSGILNVVVDTVHDRLYAVGVNGVYIVNSVSTATGSVTATAIIPLTGGSLTAVAVAP
ncbi:MAG TPA: hypothetical protein VEL09_10730, partial [Burkholderiales bacterium]|nr:hypothetical protein [Burkholderiales bacterium]